MTGDSFIALHLKDVPEGYRIPVEAALTREVPDPARVLTEAVEALGVVGKDASAIPPELIRRIWDLADLHLLLDRPIPFEAQNTFFKILDSAPARRAVELLPLREPLGFTAPS
jgi:hypothetical protein